MFARYSSTPHLIREELRAEPQRGPIIIDEVQKVPALLDEVHTMIEKIALSLRSVDPALVLGGRALRYQLFGLTSAELGDRFDIERAINFGTLPPHYLEEAPLPLLRAYVSDYLKEEVAAEGLVRNLPSFSRFLEIAAISDTGLLIYKNIAQDCGVSSPTVKEYFQILQDTMLGTMIPAYLKRPSRKTTQSSKFYFNNIGVSNLLAKRGYLERGSQGAGLALESLLLQEIRAYSHYSGKEFEVSHWKLYDDAEVDFILGDLNAALEIKSATKVVPHHLKGLYTFINEYPSVKRKIIISFDPVRRRTDTGIEVVPISHFLQELWSGEIL